tara:strand:- start:101 stop:391 length:291 start_codon:yes stop_codon:yes gene_type:complete
MTKAEQLVGKTMIHKDLGKVKVLSSFNKSRTKVEIEVIQRAKGWDENSEKYKPIKRVIPNFNVLGEEIGKSIRSKTYRHENSQYGHKDVCHINDLK